MTDAATKAGKTRPSEVTRYRMYIDGRFVDAAGGGTFDVYDPSTEAVIATCPAGGADDVDRAAKAAHRAFYDDGWRGVSAQERGRILFRLAERIRARRSELAELETRNSGKPIVDSGNGLTFKRIRIKNAVVSVPALGKTTLEALETAWAGDPVSSFGG